MCGRLRLTARAISRLYDEELRPVGLRISQIGVLWALAESGGLTQRQLGEFLTLDSTTLSRNLRRMEAQGWLLSRPGMDRRERLIAITDAGRDLLIKAHPAWQRAQERLRGAMPPELWDVLWQGLPQAAKAAQQA
jgi:DNA-binding MarR family transcriptional regulator